MLIDSRQSQCSSAIWTVIADGRQARVYECAKVLKVTPLIRSGNRYYYQESMETKLTPLPDEVWIADQIFSRPCYSNAPCTVGNTALRQDPSPQDDPTEEPKERFMNMISVKLARACAHNLFGKLIIAAPPRMLGALKGYLTPATQTRLVAEIPKELTAYNEHQLLRHIEYILPRVYAH